MSPETRAKVEAAKARIAAAKAAMEKKDDSNDQRPQPAQDNLVNGSVPATGGDNTTVDNADTGASRTADAQVPANVSGHARAGVEASTTEVRTVVTEVQPADVVVVERPAESQEHGVLQRTDDTGTQLDLTNPVHSGFLQRLGDLEAALLARDPMMPTHLREIHKTLIEYEEIMPLLTVDEISKIMSAQQTHVSTFLRQEVVKGSKAGATKRTAKVTLDDV